MKQDKEILFPAVLNEARKLKKELTFDEKANLNYELLEPASKWSCIYGQISGHCHSERAVELIKSCCKMVYTPNYNKRDTLTYAIPNGSPKKLDRNSFWSPIECLIVQSGQKKNTRKIVEYLKGDTKELTLI